MPFSFLDIKAIDQIQQISNPQLPSFLRRTLTVLEPAISHLKHTTTLQVRNTLAQNMSTLEDGDFAPKTHLDTLLRVPTANDIDCVVPEVLRVSSERPFEAQCFGLVEFCDAVDADVGPRLSLVGSVVVLVGGFEVHNDENCVEDDDQEIEEPLHGGWLMIVECSVPTFLDRGYLGVVDWRARTECDNLVVSGAIG